MMQEVSITVAYDAHVINQIYEEDIFANLVANSKPKPVVPTKKLKKFEKEYQSLRESQLQQEDPIDRYQDCVAGCTENPQTLYSILSSEREKESETFAKH
ncbi:uncharacterized protein LOC127438412 isoform X8 [Myxocyprinus asiaticus]|uniref:uncharacterized protein LOC127438412 isoform X8 n=1 Tax=Myxocyprinus asiaticus TaxID=70543 RepID=UPI0022220D8D|nr:uncharacterized protein LOC127438412 isoform X8 [Myxocyprinus asiaticus]